MQTKALELRQKWIVLLMVGLLYSLGLAYFFQGLPAARLTSDFFPRWYASRMLLTTERSVYDWANAEEISAITGWPYLNHLGYYYPAYLLLFTVPLSLLPYEIAHILWTVFGLWCLWLGMVILGRLLGISLNQLTLLLVLVTISIPVLQHTLYAQFNALGVLALALSYQALARKKYLLAGIWAGGLLFKPQATLLPLCLFIGWTMFERERRRFWPGLILISIALWAGAEILEPGWVVHFWQSLESYEPILSIVDRIWNPYQVVSLSLSGFTLWLAWRLRHVPADSMPFRGLLAWTISLNALIVPMYGMMHIVLMGVVFILVLHGLFLLYPAASAWMWAGVIGLFIAGLLAFIIPLFLVGPTGLHIAATEMVYRIIMPILLGLASLLLVFKFKNETIYNYSRL